MAEVTLSYSEKGWPSFYSFIPDTMIGINGRFYSAKNGALWLHNSDNVNRCSFYGSEYDHSVELIINDSPVTNKLFKSIKLESSYPYDVSIESDLQDGGFIDKTWMDKRENSWYAFVRNTGSTPEDIEDYALRRITGIGFLSGVSGSSGSRVVAFPVDINISDISMGDSVYHFEAPYDEPIYSGSVTNIEVDKVNGINRITINDSLGGAITPPSGDVLIAVAKNATAESDGILGHYAKITLTGDENANLSEIASIEAEVMVSRA